MKEIYFSITFIIISCLCWSSVTCQHISPIDYIYASKLGHLWPRKNGSDLDKILYNDYYNKNIFLYFGFYGCHGCHAELPVIIDIARNKGSRIIYCTYNDSTIVDRELKEIIGKDCILPKNFSIVHISESEIAKRALAIGYPTYYYLDSNKRIISFNFGTSNGFKYETIYRELSMIIK